MLRQWLRYLWDNEDGFFGIGQGPTKEEKNQYGEIGALSNFGTSQGESAISTSNDFWKAILSGDPSSISRVLGPQLSAINKQGQQQKKTLSEFGNRGGGTNAEAQTIGDRTREAGDSLVSSLTGTAAGALGASGESLLAAGLSGHEAAFSAANVIQQQKAAKLNDIFKSISSIASSFFSPGGMLNKKKDQNIFDTASEVSQNIFG